MSGGAIAMLIFAIVVLGGGLSFCLSKAMKNKK
jgi:hypothetical protein